MLTWTIVSYPVPFDTGGTYTLGIVTAVDEASARQLALDSLALEGLDITNIDPLEIGLIPWDTNFGACKLVWG